MDKKNRRPFSTNDYERKIFKIVFLSAGIPVFIVIGFFYCLFNDLVYTYLNSGMADHFIYQFLVLSIIILMYYFLFVGVIAYRYIPRFVGAIPRIIKELDDAVTGKSKAHISVRDGDYVQKLISRINALIDKLP